MPSWTELYDGPWLILWLYPARKLTRDSGASVRLRSVIRRTVLKRCGELSEGTKGFESGGIRGFARRL